MRKNIKQIKSKYENNSQPLFKTINRNYKMPVET
jgi:hypothetical protein